MDSLKKLSTKVGNIIPVITITILCSPIYSWAQSPIISNKVGTYTNGIVTAISGVAVTVGTGAASILGYKMMAKKADFGDVWHMAAGGLIVAAAGAFGLYTQS